MEGQEEIQQPHLVLAHKLFLLSHPDVQDIEKVRLREEVLAFVKADGNSQFSLSFIIQIQIMLDLNGSPFAFYRYGSVVRNPNFGVGAGDGSGLFELDACQDRGRAQEA